MINIMAWMREAGISGDQTRAQADRLRLKSIPSGTAPIRPGHTFGVSGIKGASTPARRSSGSEGEEEASVMVRESRAAVVKKDRALTPMDEGVRAKVTQLPIKEQRRSFLEIRTQGHYLAIDRNTGHRRLHRLGGCYRVPHVNCSVFSFVRKKLPSDSAYDLHCRRCCPASAPTAGPLTSDSDGTCEVSLESEPGDQRGRATFLG